MLWDTLAVIAAGPHVLSCHPQEQSWPLACCNLQTHFSLLGYFWEVPECELRAEPLELERPWFKSKSATFELCDLEHACFSVSVCLLEEVKHLQVFCV